MRMHSSAKSRRGAISMFVAVLLAGLPVAVSWLMNDWYVDANWPLGPGGNGTPARPFCDIMDAVAVASDGDTIHIAPGTFFGNVMLDKDMQPWTGDLCALSPEAIVPESAIAQVFLDCPSPGSMLACGRPRSLYEATASFENGEVCAIRQHLGAVLDLLESRDVSTLSPGLRSKRRLQIERLFAYRERGVFPNNEQVPTLAPVFIDRESRSCAVAYLMIESGSRELAERVAAVQNNAYVPGITVPGVAQWIGDSGLDAEECAMIQPSYPGPCDGLMLRPGVCGFTPTCGHPATVSSYNGDGINVDVLSASPMALGGTWTASVALGHSHGSGGTLILRLRPNTINGKNFGSPIGGRRAEVLIDGPLMASIVGVHDGITGSFPPQAVPWTVCLRPWAAQVVVIGGGFVDLSTAVFGVAGDGVVADFSGAPRSGGTPLTVSFTDLSANSPTGWFWDFGDGGTSSLQHPTHTYSSVGSYTVSLTASNAFSSHRETKMGYVRALGVATDFSGSPRSGAVPLTVSFTDLSANSPTSWFWEFGDGSTSSLQHPTHTYSSLGNFTVSLTASNAFSSGTETKMGYIEAVGVAAAFRGSPRSGAVPLIVSFTDLSANSPTSWFWDFGDGGTSSLQHPTHTYSSPGTFTVSLTASNAFSSDMETKTGYIEAMAIVVNFTGAPRFGAAPLTVSFTDLSASSPTSWFWDFGDGGTSSLQHPTHTYSSPGTFTVSLAASNALGFSTETKTDYIHAR